LPATDKLRPAGHALPRGAFFLLFTISGFAGLIYESIWSHYLKLFLGHAAYAQTLVLALFMGGMAIGSVICSRLSGRWRNLLRGYAIAEAVIGLAAMAFHPLFVATTGAAYDSWLPGLHSATGSESATAMLKWVLAGALILPQSILLGMTFPLMSAGIIRRHPDAPGETLAMLYFTNSLGAAVGVLASGFLMIDHLGLAGTMQGAGIINLLLAAVVWLLSPGADPAPPALQAARRENDGTPIADVPYGLMLVIALFTGAASFMYEIGWIRMLSLVLGSSTHSFELMLSSFILGLAFGGLWVKRRIDRIADPVRFLAIVQVAMGLLALATLPLYGQMFPLMQKVIEGLAQTDTGYSLFLLASHGIALLVMFPASFCAGMTLPLITYALLRGGHGEKAIGAVYGANTLGAILGVFAAAHLGMPLLGLKGLISAGAAIDIGLGLAILWLLTRNLRLSVGATAISAAAFIGILFTVQLDLYHMASGVFRKGALYSEKDGKLIYYKDGKTTSVSLIDFGEGRSLRTNGKSDGAIDMSGKDPISDEVTMTLTGALPQAFKPDAKTAAVIGIGTGLTTHTLLANAKFERVDTIEIEPAMAQASRLFAPVNANAFADPRSNIVFDDAKTYFSTHNRRYDLIISEPSNPWVSGVSSLFTGEFYRIVKRYLQPGGIMVQWIQLYEIDLSLVASVLRALGDNFPDYAIYASTDGDLLIVAGDEKTLAQPLADITEVPGVSRELSRLKVFSLGDVELRRIGGKKSLAPFFASYDVPANSDFAPYLDLNAARYRFLHRSAGAFTAIGTTGVPVIDMIEGRDGTRRGATSYEGEEYFEKIGLLRKAQYVRDFLVKAKPPEPVNISRAMQKDLDIVKLRLIECRDPLRYDIWFHSLYQLAYDTNPMLSAAEGRALWEFIQRSPCLSTLSAEQRRWVELFKAIGSRDAARMAQMAEMLLTQQSDLPTGHRQYLIAAGMAGYLAQSRPIQAAGLWNSYPDDVKDLDKENLNLRLLHAHAMAAPSGTKK